MAKAKKTKYGVKLERPYKIINGSKKFEVELNTKEVSIISNSLKNFENNKFLLPRNKKDVKKLFVFFDSLLDE